MTNQPTAGPKIPLRIALNGRNLDHTSVDLLKLVEFQAVMTWDNSPIYKVTKDQLLPAARAQYDKLVKENLPPGQKPEIYVNPHIGFNDSDSFAAYINIPDVGLKPPPNKKFVTGPVIFVSEAGRRWTEKDAPPLLSEKKILDQYPLFVPQNDEQKRFVEEFDKMAKRKNLVPTPVLLINKNKNMPAAALLSKEGKQFVLIKPSFPLKELLAYTEHETAHLKNGDLKTPNAIKAHNSNAVGIAMEVAADKDVINNCRAGALSDSMKKEFDNFIRATGFSSFQQMSDSQILLDPKHPAPADRLRYLDAAASNPPPGCKPTKQR